MIKRHAILTAVGIVVIVVVAAVSIFDLPDGGGEQCASLLVSEQAQENFIVLLTCS